MSFFERFFNRFRVIPYIGLVIGLVLLFTSDAWNTIYNEHLAASDTVKHVTRRDIDADLREKYYYAELNKLSFNALESPSTPLTDLSNDEPLINAHQSEPENEPVEMDMPTEEVHRATVDELRQTAPALGAPPPNRRFIFHNKIPKAGSTTMKWLLVALANKNKFTLDHVRPCVNQDTCQRRLDHGRHYDGPDGEEALKEYLPERRKEAGEGNFFLLKHHHWFNFTQFDMEMPTYINVARDPVTRYASWYYFERFGWARHEGERPKFFGDGEDKERSFDDCVIGGYQECLEPLQVLVRYFCGTDTDQCGMMAGDGHDWTMVAKATERAKQIITQNFYVVGVLEHFTSTLQLFEKMLPEYFTGAVDVSQTDDVQKQRDSSKSSNGAIKNETRHILETGVLRYEVDIYNLVKSLFFEKLRYYNLPMPV